MKEILPRKNFCLKKSGTKLFMIHRIIQREREIKNKLSILWKDKYNY